MNVIRKLYQQLQKQLNLIDFNNIWKGFHVFDFALYNDNEVFLKDEVIQKDERFYGNTAIKYQNTFLAIWYINPKDIEKYEKDSTVLLSKIVHEMFHAYQFEQGEQRWPHEVKSLLTYQYDAVNLSIKKQENEMLFTCLDQFDMELFKDFLRTRKSRQQQFPSQFDYEAKTEVIEGFATYVELMALKMLDQTKYLKTLSVLKDKILNEENYFPIRLICYDIGGLIAILCKENEMDWHHDLSSTTLTLSEILFNRYLILSESKTLNVDSDIEKMVIQFENENKILIEETLKKCNAKHEGKYKLLGVDPYNARAYKYYIYCPGFFALINPEGKQEFIFNTGVVEIDDDLTVISCQYITTKGV
ncbi:hypothetical protein [Peloplasma aerotolerans]|uniref:Uncharacterized protein n=1 Tax=Peloplasma aerotolerans TaxID=3044389 RepID=A0AAW6UAH1_9MOLU|nr:hypothetical protein [Mariniplasma sp. M4Ah]MDI6453101.1 hypothetical protein [Mariniplasma sp. M4Ah]